MIVIVIVAVHSFCILGTYIGYLTIFLILENLSQTRFVSPGVQRQKHYFIIIIWQCQVTAEAGLWSDDEWSGQVPKLSEERSLFVK